MIPTECPKRSKCNAPVCPLDPNWQRCTTLTGEASCVFLREAVKIDGVVPAEMRPRIDEALPLILNRSAGGFALRKALKRAAACGTSRARESVIRGYC
jgi:hypothetical protein